VSSGGAAVLRIWGRISSVNVQRAVWAAGEAGQPFERIDVGGAFGGLDTAEYGARNPNRMIPVLEDGELVTWESNSIVRYLAARYGAGSLWDEDPARRAVADRWMDWAVIEFQRWLGPLFLQLVRTPPDRRKPELIEEAAARCEEKLVVLDRHLAQVRHLAGDGFSMADISLGPCLHRWLHLPLAREPRPHVERWYREIAARPAAVPALPLPIA